MTVSILGLGKLGVCMAAAMASRGLNVIGYDNQPDTLSAFDAGETIVVEPDLKELISANRQRLRAADSTAEAIHDSAFTFVVVPTPSDDTGAFSLEYVITAFTAIGTALATKPDFHHVVLCSTVLPNAMRQSLIPALEQASGKRCGQDFTVSYNPEFIALGSVIHDYLNPDFSLIGEYNPAGGDALEALLNSIILNDSPCKRLTIENAEITKIALNAYVTTKITFANMLADFCEKIPGGDAQAVCGALGSDTRIGRKYFLGGTPFGGPCFPRDNRALEFFATQIGCSADIPRATINSNRAGLGRLVAEALSLINKSGSKIAVLGLAYKSGTPVIDESPGVMLCSALAAAGHTISAHDFLSPSISPEALPFSVSLHDSIRECLEDASLVIITLPESGYSTLTLTDFSSVATNAVVLDCWHVLPAHFADQSDLQILRRGEGRESIETDSL